jgi:hypothetical protein
MRKPDWNEYAKGGGDVIRRWDISETAEREQDEHSPG